MTSFWVKQAGRENFLTMHFFEKFAAKLDRPVARLTPDALEILMQFDWPGNVRELENEIERALTLAGDDGELNEEYLSERIKGSPDIPVTSDETPTTMILMFVSD